MQRVVLDSTILVSAFLTRKGVSAELLRSTSGEAFSLYLCREILEETGRVLLEHQRIRSRYRYRDDQVVRFVEGLSVAARMVKRLPNIKGVVRDSTDDMVLACCLKAHADYLVTRDEDLLTLKRYKRTAIHPPDGLWRSSGQLTIQESDGVRNANRQSMLFRIYFILSTIDGIGVVS